MSHDTQLNELIYAQRSHEALFVSHIRMSHVCHDSFADLFICVTPIWVGYGQ